jgi:8-oxo-dGTP pyrophosphatase MutT (NUDIX family)
VSDAPATPRPAATVLLLRHGGRHSDRGVEVLLCRRSPEASFMPGVWVFPGGMIEEGETAQECAARELAEEVGIELGEEAELVAWSRWITPEVVPVRFDTHFFVALAEPHAKAEADGGEITDVAWWAPQAALDSHAQGELKLVFPTIKTLETLVEHETAEAVIEAARDRDVQPILPRVAGTVDDHRVLLPWDEGYEDAVTNVKDLPE